MIVLESIETVYKIYEAANGIDKEHEEEKYREAVLEQLKHLDEGIDQLESDLKRLLNLTKYQGFWGAAGNPIQAIDLSHNLWLQKTKPPHIEVECNNIEKAMLSLYMAICGEIDNAQPGENALQLFIAGTDTNSLRTSQLEYTYSYYASYLLGRLVKGFSLLGAYRADESVKNWYRLFKDGTPDASEPYLKGPYLQYAGSYCQRIIANQNLNDFNWLGTNIEHKKAFKIQKIRVNAVANLPDGSVVTGLDIQSNKGDASLFDIYVSYGTFKPNGYVENIQSKLLDGGDSVIIDSFSTREQYSMRLIKAKLLDTRPLIAPDGHVIIDISLMQKVRGHDFNNPYRTAYHDPEYFSLVFFRIRYASVKNGEIDYTTAQWADLANDSMVDDISDYSRLTGEHSNRPDLAGIAPAGIEWFESGPYSPWNEENRIRTWETWVNTPGNNDDLSVPISGVQFHNNRIIYRIDSHKNSFQVSTEKTVQVKKTPLQSPRSVLSPQVSKKRKKPRAQKKMK